MVLLDGLGPPAPDPTAALSEDQWLTDLAALLQHAHHRFADVAWSDDASGRVIHAHKCIVYARATGSFQQRYLGVPHSLSESDLSLYGLSTTSFRTFTPSSAIHRDSLTPTVRHNGRSPRPSSSTCHSNDGDDSPSNGVQPLSLGETDSSVFEGALEYFYTASKESEAFVVALDGFQDGAADGEQEFKGVARLRQDLLYCWRSKLYSDVSIVLDGVPGEPFAAHRAILASRSPYFRSLLLGSYSDSTADVFTLPSPPFTPASTTFVLGYIYTGTLDFSPRKFDLATHFEIWRCAAFLTLATLQSAIEAKVLAQLNLARAPRILAFAHAPDVNSLHLADAATLLVTAHFDTAWTATPHVGNLPYEVQKALVRSVCNSIAPSAVASTARQVARSRRQIEAERAAWAEHVRGMLDGVEEALVGVLAAHLPEVVASSGFVDLIDGVGFSTDVLEWLLTLVVKGLKEAKAPEAYQALVGSVLLREEGIMADARLLVDDTRSGILGYIKRKWVNIRNAGGFDSLEAWCLKELADELDVPSGDLISDNARSPTGPSKVRKPPQHLVDGVPSVVTPPASHPSASRPPHGLSPPPASAAPRTRIARLSTSSTTSRAPTVVPRPAATRTPAPRAPAAGAAPPISTPPSRRAPLSGLPHARAAPPATVVTQATPRQLKPARPAAVTAASPRPVPPGPKTALRSTATSRPSSVRSVASRTAARVRSPPTTTQGPDPRRPASPASSIASRRSVASAATTRRPGSPATSVASRRSVASTATTRRPASPAASVASRRSVASTATTRRPLGASSATPAGARPLTTSAATPVPGAQPCRSPSTLSLRSTLSTRGSSTAPPVHPLRPPAPSTSPPSRRSASTSSVAVAVAGAGAAARASSTPRRAAAAAAASGAPEGSTMRPTPRARPPLAPSVGTSRRSRLPPGPGTAAAGAAQTPGLPVPGTTLLAGIPCIVTVRHPSVGASASAGAGKALRIKAQVRYIGELVDERGQWVGVEAIASAIPPEADSLEWGDGQRGEVRYFTLTPPTPDAESAPPSRAGSPALRPPSRRAARRSTSPSGARESGPRKGLFVRPDQIVYVL